MAGCAASKQYFVPIERVQGQTPHGYVQASYPLQGPGGVFGEVTLYSRGAYPTHDGTTVVHVGVLLHNTSAQPVVLDPADVKLVAVRTRGGVLHDIPAAEREKLAVAPQAKGEAFLHFKLPADVSPGEIEAFALAWAVRGPTSTYYQRTTFAERERKNARYYGPYDRYPCWPYGPYDCFWGPPYPGAYAPPVVLIRDEPERGGRVTVEGRR